MARPRSGIGGQPTIPQFVGMLATTFACLAAQPPEIQRQALVMLTETLAVSALDSIASVTPKSVV